MVTYKHFKYVHEFRDRHGKIRRYFRRRGFKQVALHGEPGTEEFADAYQRAIDGTPQLIGAARNAPGTVAAALASYFASAGFAGFAPETRRTWRYHLERFRADHGDKRVAMLRPEHVDRIMAAKAKQPPSARNFLKALRSFMRWCVTAKLCADDPTANMKLPKVKTQGYRPWSEDEIAAYRQRHAVGTRARLALELLLNLGSRRSDVILMGRQHLRGGEFTYRTKKNGTLVEGVPLLPECAEALEAMPKSEHLTFLITHFGKSFTPAGFGNWFRDMCDEAGVPKGYSAHGLRKASATRLAELGATAHQLMSWHGWATLREPERYTRSANNKKLARAAGELLKTGTSIGKPE